MNKWQLQEAKAKFSEVVKKAVSKGPQMVTLHGQPIVIVLSQDEYNHLIAPKSSLVDFFQQSPLKGISLDLTRDKSTDRGILL